MRGLIRFIQDALQSSDKLATVINIFANSVGYDLFVGDEFYIALHDNFNSAVAQFPVEVGLSG